MIYIFNADERLEAVLSNNKNACPIFEADFTEVLNGELLLTFSVPAEHAAAAFVKERAFAGIERKTGEFEIFYIYEIEEQHEEQTIKKAFCRHASVELADEPIERISIDRKDAATALTTILEGTRWEAGQVVATGSHDLTVDKKSVLEGLETLLKRYGLEVKYRFIFDDGKIARRYIDLVERRGEDAGRRFEFTKDLTSVMRTVNIEELKTAVIPYGSERSDEQNAEQETTTVTIEGVKWTNNLIGSFKTDWQLNANATALEDYVLELNATGSAQFSRTTIEVTPNETYIIKGEIEGDARVRISKNDSTNMVGGTWIADFWGGESTFTVPADTSEIVLAFGQRANVGAGYYKLSNPNLEHETIKQVPFEKPLGQNYLGDEDARERFGLLNDDGTRRHRYHIYKVTADTAEELIEKAADWLQANNEPKAQYSCKVVDLEALTGITKKNIELGDSVAVIDLDLDIRLAARIIELKRDLLQDEQSEIVLGNFMPVLTDDDIEQLREEVRLANAKAAANETPQDVIREGDTILTDWLEDEIALRTKKLRAGGGSVTLDDENGILIEEDAVNKAGGALRLLGGQLALADSYNFSLGDYNWRAFGTGEGFLADLVQTGKLRFNNASGGTLTLGGEDNQNGVMIVRDSIGQNIAELSGDYGGFGELRIDELKDTQNVVYKSYQKTQALYEDGNIRYYVSAYEGNDDNEGTEDAPLASVQEAIDRLPKFLNHNAYIVYIPTLLQDTEINIEGFMGSGILSLQRWKIPVRTIQDFIVGSSSNGGNHWVEIDGELIGGGTKTFAEVSHVKEGMSTDATASSTQDTTVVVDGDIQGAYYESQVADGAENWIAVYTGGEYADSFEHVRVWHYWKDGRTYYGTKTKIGSGIDNLHTVFDSERQGTYAESADGHRINVNKAYLKGTITMRNNMARVEVKDMFIDSADAGSTPPIRAFYNKYIYINNVVLFGNDSTSYLFYCIGTNGLISACETNNASAAAVYCEQGNLYLYSIKGSNVSYAFRAHGAGLIAGSSHAPYSTNNIEWTTNGGTISGSWIRTTGEFSPITITEKRETWTNTSADSWAEHYDVWNSSSNDVLQGKWDVYGLYRGCWFFGSSIKNAVNGKTIKKIRVYVTRANSSGYSSAVPIYIMPHGYASKPSYAPSLFTSNVVTKNLARGESAWIDCTDKFKDLFENGQAYGIGIYTSNTSNNVYARMTQTAKIEITYEEII